MGRFGVFDHYRGSFRAVSSRFWDVLGRFVKILGSFGLFHLLVCTLRKLQISRKKLIQINFAESFSRFQGKIRNESFFSQKFLPLRYPENQLETKFNFIADGPSLDMTRQHAFVHLNLSFRFQNHHCIVLSLQKKSS